MTTDTSKGNGWLEECQLFNQKKINGVRVKCQGQPALQVIEVFIDPLHDFGGLVVGIARDHFGC